MRRDLPYPNHTATCPFQLVPIGTQCTCGTSEWQFHHKFHTGELEECPICRPTRNEMTESSYLPQLWDYSAWTEQTRQPFGDETTYRLGLGWLYQGVEDVEDWGAGMAYGRRFCPPGKRYFAVDGSPSSAPFVDLVINLRDYVPLRPAEGIFMRHVLEHNLDWREILQHALASFTKRFCLVLFTPLTTEETHPLRDPTDADAYRDLSFNRTELITQFPTDALWSEKTVRTNTQYQYETLFYIERLT